MTLFDDSIITWILTCVCAPQCIKNPYVTAKLVEVLFVISPQNTGLQISVSIEANTGFQLHLESKLHNLNLGHEPSARSNRFG